VNFKAFGTLRSSSRNSQKVNTRRYCCC